MPETTTIQVQKGTNVDAREANQIALRRCKSERNFLAFPFFALSNRDAKRRRKTETHVSFTRNGTTYEGKAQILTAEGFIFPTPFDKKVHKAIEYLITQRGFPIENPFYFSAYQVLKLLGLSSKSGANIEKVKESCERIAATTIRARRLVYNKRKDALERGDVFRVFDYSFVSREERGEEDIQHHWVTLSKWYLDNLANNFVRPLDFEYFKSLDNDVARRLYELVGLSFYGVFVNQNREGWQTKGFVKYRYNDLCQQLPLTPQKYASKANQQLAPAHSVLIQTSFIKRVVWEQRKDDWTIKYFPGDRAIKEHDQNKRLVSEPIEQLELSLSESKRLEVGESPKNAPEAKNRVPTGSSEVDQTTKLASLLIERGIKPRAAGNLAKKHPNRIERNVQVFDFLLQRQDHGIKNPPAYLVRAIQENWFITSRPEGFISQEEQEEQRQRQEEVAQELAREYGVQRQQVIKDVEALVKLAPEQRVAQLLDAWEKTERTIKRRAPTPEEKTERQARYIQNLPSKEKLLNDKLRELQAEFESRAREQGIEGFDFIPTPQEKPS